MLKSKVSVGILINDVVVPQWIYSCIENLIESDYAGVNLIIRKEKPCKDLKQQLIPGGYLLARMFETFDGLVFRNSHSSQLKKDISSLKDRISVFDLTDTNSVNSGNNDVKKDVITQLNLDVVILFGSNQLDHEILGTPRYGFWAFSHEKNKIPCTPDHGFREVIKHLPLTDTVLKIVKPDPLRNEVLYVSRESTYHYSVTVNRNKILWRATHILPMIIEGLFNNGDSYLDQLKERNKTHNTEREYSPYRRPFFTVLRDVIAHIAQLVWLGFNKLIYTDAFSWQLMIDVRKDQRGIANNFGSFSTVNSPQKMFWADPFVVAENNKYYIFVEEFIYRKNKAHISVIELDERGQFKRSGKIIEKSYHMSYPFTFKLGGTYYMIPETSQNRTIELYKCKDFPYIWEFDRNIMENISATDSTLLFYENKWWLFTTLDLTNGISGCSTELFLFYSDDIFSGKWKGHPLNPVVSDESNARCAGKLFMKDGELYRPSQDCSLRYGRGFNINRVTKLNIHEYNETRVQEVKPDWNRKLKGTHTINYDGGLTVIDVYSFHRRISLK